MILLSRPPMVGVMIAALCLLAAGIVALLRRIWAVRQWKRIRAEYESRRDICMQSPANQVEDPPAVPPSGTADSAGAHAEHVVDPKQ